MTTQIIEPTSNIYNLQLQIPDEFIGKKIAVNYEQMEVIDEPSKETTRSIESISDIFKDCRVSHNFFILIKLIFLCNSFCKGTITEYHLILWPRNILSLP